MKNTVFLLTSALLNNIKDYPPVTQIPETAETVDNTAEPCPVDDFLDFFMFQKGF